MKKINVLSLFDGMSCGQQALERSCIQVENYFASEIDKYAITVTMANYPNTIQLGSVIDVDGYKLPKIDLLMGGSPCQSFSFAGKRKGMATKCETEILTLEHYLELKSDGYEFEGQSYLFWEYMRILKEVKPKYFLLENVEMGEKWEKVLSKAIGVNGIHLNSSLVSAQNRKRIYWTNIGMKPGGLFGDLESIIKQPKDKGILLKDILESEVDEKYYLSEKMLMYLNSRKSNYNNGKINYKTENDIASCINKSSGSIDISDNIIIDTNRKSRTFTAGGNSGGLHSQMDLIVHNTMPRSGNPKQGGTGHLSRSDGKTYCLDTGNTNAVEIKAVMLGRSEAWGMPKKNDGKSYTLCKEQPHGIILTSKDKRLKQTIDENNLTEGKIKALDTYNQSIHDRYPTLKDPKHNDRALFDGSRIRRLTPIECERLQTVADNYTAHVSDSQRYRMLGNGWTVDVIAHIFSYLKF
jgi:DNA (cytosine-5)-methyltransferase 3A